MEFEKAKAEAMAILEVGLTNDLYFHNVDHTLDVFAAAQMLAQLENVAGHDLTLLLTAAMYHDLGYTKTYKNHEAASIEIARKILPSFSYQQEDIEKISGMIAATKVPQLPKNLLEEILCDADLDYLGRDDYYALADNLKREFVEKKIIEKDDWIKVQIEFLTSHRFFTKSAQKLRFDHKALRLIELHSQIK